MKNRLIAMLLVSFGSFTLCSQSIVEDNNGVLSQDPTESIHQALENGVDISKKDEAGRTLIHKASECDDKSLCDRLVKRGADIFAVDRNDETPLHYAARSGNAETCRFIIDAQKMCVCLRYGFAQSLINTFRVSSINKQNVDGYTPLHLAALNDRTAACRALVEMGAYIDVGDEENLGCLDFMKKIQDNMDTPLDLACKKGHYFVAEYLVKRKATIRNRSFKYALEAQHPKLYALLIEYEPALDINKRVNITLLKKNKKDKKNVIVREQTALHIAVRAHNFAVCKFLVQKGCDVYAADLSGVTPLHLAIGEREFEISKLLIEAMQDVDFQDCNGFSPLIFAVIHGEIETCKLLLAKGANTGLSIQNTKDTALHVAIKKNHAGICKLLLNYDVNVNLENAQGFTPLDLIENGGVGDADDNDDGNVVSEEIKQIFHDYECIVCAEFCKTWSPCCGVVVCKEDWQKWMQTGKFCPKCEKTAQERLSMKRSAEIGLSEKDIVIDIAASSDFE